MLDEQAPAMRAVARSSAGTMWRAIGFALVSLGIAAGIGYYAWNLREEHLLTTSKLAATELIAQQVDEERKTGEMLLTQLTACQNGLKIEEERCKGVERNASSIQGDLSATKIELETLQKHREETLRRLAAFEEMTTKFKKMIDNGKVDVINRNGRLLVNLPSSVLFTSGSAELSRLGELALMEVAIVLREFSDRSFIIEGHTDDRPLEDSAESRFKDNWELSTARAVTVTRFLIEARMKPENVVAAGHSSYDPVGDNQTRSGRQENRRIEIVMVPNLDKLPSLDELPPAGEAPSSPPAEPEDL